MDKGDLEGDKRGRQGTRGKETRGEAGNEGDDKGKQAMEEATSEQSGDRPSILGVLYTSLLFVHV